MALKINAALLRAEGLFEAAIAASKVVIAQNPGEPWAHKEVGLSELYLGRFQDAEASLQRGQATLDPVLAARPHSIPALFLAGTHAGERAAHGFIASAAQAARPADSAPPPPHDAVPDR